jgi:hypothetical protein
MEMQLYLLHVVPFIVLVYLAFLLFLRPPGRVILASILGGLTMAVINALVDLIAYYASWWHYILTGLILQLPLPFYITPILIYGGLTYLLIWRFWDSRWHWFALLLLIGVPLIGFARDLLQAVVTHSSFLAWDSPLAGPLDLLLWLVMFYAGFFVFRLLAPPRKSDSLIT